LRRRDDPIRNFPGNRRVVDSRAINLTKQIRNSESGEEIGKNMSPAKPCPEPSRRNPKAPGFEETEELFLCALGALAGENFLKNLI
jgi:hypothetical protein